MYPFTLRQLQIFVAAAQYKSFATAARILHMSKPAITKQIQALELHSNAKLFNKSGRTMVLSEEGKRILQQAKKILNEANRLKQIQSLGLDKEKPILRFSMGHTFSPLIFKALRDFCNENFTQYDISIEPMEHQFERVEANEVDFVITEVKIDSPYLVYLPYRKIQFYLVASRQNPITEEIKPSLRQLRANQFIQIKGKKTLENTLQTKYDLVKKTFERRIQMESYYGIKEAIKANLGIGILPEILLKDESSDLAIIHIKEFEFKRQLYLVTNKEDKEIKEKFTNFLISHIDS